MKNCIDHGQKSVHDGYGRTYFDGKHGVKMHRVAYCKAHNLLLSDIQGCVIRHTCDNPRCINPEHLIIGNQKDNISDCISRGRRERFPNRYCGKGMTPNAKLNPENIIEIKKRYTPRDKYNSAVALANEFGVNKSIIYRILAGKIWSHVEIE